MFTPNNEHRQKSLFSNEQSLSDKMKKRLNNSWAELFYTDIFCKIDESIFTPIYCENNGRPNFPINILVGLEILKELHNHTDEILYDRFLFDMLYQHALGIENIDEYDFSIRTLYNFRSALSSYDQNNNTNLMKSVFENLRDDAIEKCNINTSIQRADTVMIQANIKQMSRLMLFHKVMTNLVKQLQTLGMHVEKSILELTKVDENHIAYRISKEDVHETIKQLGGVILRLTETYKSSPKVVETKAYQDAIRLLSEQCNIKKLKSTKLVTLKEPKDINSGSMQNPADGDATYRKKRDEEYKGYVTFASETCTPENEIQIVTDVETFKNNVDDTKIGVSQIPNIKEMIGLETIIIDGGFPSDELTNISNIENKEFDFIATAIRGRKPNKNKTVGIDQFKLNDIGLIEKCPNGHKPIKQDLKDDILKANFDRKICNECPMKKNCVAYISEKSCKIKITKHARWLNERRLKMNDNEYIELCKLRSAVEGLMDKLKPKSRDGRTSFRGIEKVSNRMILKAIGINFKRISAYKRKKLVGFIGFLLKHIKYSLKYHFQTTDCHI